MKQQNGRSERSLKSGNFQVISISQLLSLMQNSQKSVTEFTDVTPSFFLNMAVDIHQRYLSVLLLFGSLEDDMKTCLYKVFSRRVAEVMCACVCVCVCVCVLSLIHI